MAEDTHGETAGADHAAERRAGHKDDHELENLGEHRAGNKDRQDAAQARDIRASTGLPVDEGMAALEDTGRARKRRGTDGGQEAQEGARRVSKRFKGVEDVAASEQQVSEIDPEWLRSI